MNIISQVFCSLNVEKLMVIKLIYTHKQKMVYVTVLLEQVIADDSINNLLMLSGVILHHPRSLAVADVTMPTRTHDLHSVQV